MKDMRLTSIPYYHMIFIAEENSPFDISDESFVLSSTTRRRTYLGITKQFVIVSNEASPSTDSEL